MAENLLSAEAILDRRQLKRRVTFWRVAALVLLALLVIASLWAAGAFKNYGKKSADHIARVTISGVITNDKPLLELLEDLGEKDQVRAVILDISSPGGSTVGGEAIYEAVLALAKEKPVVTSVGTLAASAGYMIAVASDHIVARRSSIVGSIGVIFQYGQVSELLDKIGVDVKEIKSAPLKAEPSPFHQASPEAEAMINRLVQDSYQWFVGIVADRRSFSPAKALQLADGSIFSGSQGLDNGLIDAIGDEETARKWLVSEREVSDDLEILDWKPDRGDQSILTNPVGIAGSALGWIGERLGLDPSGKSIEAIRNALPQRLFLDGLISILQVDDGYTENN